MLLTALLTAKSLLLKLTADSAVNGKFNIPDNLRLIQWCPFIIQFKERHPNASNYQISKCFSEMGVAKSTVYNNINNYKNREIRKGCPTKYNILLPYTNKINGGSRFKAFKKEKVSYLLENQIETQCRRVRKFHKHLLSFGKNSPVMDDESYFTLANNREMLQMT